MAKDKSKIVIGFQFCNIKIDPYKESSGTNSSSIFRDIAKDIYEKKLKKEVKFFDRNKDNKNADPRYIGILQLRIDAMTSTVSGRMALLLEKNPVLLKDNYDIDHISQLEDRKFAQITHFVVNYSGNRPIAILEKNQSGARMSDLEYILRHYGKHLAIGKFCQIKPYMDKVSDEMINKITHVDFIDVQYFRVKRTP